MPFDADPQTFFSPRWRSLQAEEAPGRLNLMLEGRPLIALRVAGTGPHLEVRLDALDAERVEQALWTACYWLLARDPACQRLQWTLSQVPLEALALGLLVRDGEPGRYRCERTLFWQLPRPWLGDTAAAVYPQQMQITAGKRHPRRPPKPQGEVYRRFDPRIGAWVSLRTLSVEHDLERFNRWQNTPRVLQFWKEGGTLAQHHDYLSRLEQDPHTVTLIGCFDDQPFAYFEAYWAKEDRIAPFYPVDDYDRGVHMLVGEDTHRGPHKVASWLSALTHYLFLDDPRTQHVVAEPRADNDKMIGYLQAQGFYREKTFDFPHKRAALMRVGREAFFERCGLL
jgi:acetyl CoA:N6-hydroxylysine acetyl transferase